MKSLARETGDRDRSSRIGISAVRFADLKSNTSPFPSDESLGYYRLSASRTTKHKGTERDENITLDKSVHSANWNSSDQRPSLGGSRRRATPSLRLRSACPAGPETN